MSGLYTPTPREQEWNVLPGLGKNLVFPCTRKLELVRGVMTGLSASLICFQIQPNSPKRKRYDYVVWKGSAERGFLIEKSSNHMTASVLSEICGGFVPLAVEISSRWPERARPRQIGFATDGHRIMFNAEHPDCLGFEWMEQHLNGMSPASIIYDDGIASTLEMLCPSKRNVP
jgi:hypothetical protein